MPVDMSCRQIFLASPGGLATERDRCRALVAHWHATRALGSRSTFYVHAWEDVPGGVARPQAKINGRLDDCDYMVLLLADRWGSPPGGNGGFESGTEEEFHHACRLLADPEAPMRDFLVLFKVIDDAQLRDPGPQLQRVLGFRHQLEESKQVMFETFDSLERLHDVLERKLEEWSMPLSQKVAVTINLPTASGAPSSTTGVSEPELLAQAKLFADSGSLVHAEAAFAAAIAGGNVDAILAYAQFMRRTGRLAKARDLNEQVIATPGLLIGRDATSSRQRVRALAGIGLIERSQGHLAASLRTLREAVSTADTSDAPVPEELCYALDNLGWTLVRSGREFEAEAAAAFERSHELRRDVAGGFELAQSAINLGRFAMVRGEYADAESRFDEALSLVPDEVDVRLRANALCGLAEARMRSDSAYPIAALLDTAIELNGKVGHSDGASIAHALMARYLLDHGTVGDVEAHMRQAREISLESGNRTGQAVALWLEAELLRRRGDFAGTHAALLKARDVAGSNIGRLLQDDITHTAALASAPA